MKRWELPVIEALDLTKTAWTEIEGDIPDQMFQDCDRLYYPKS